MENVNDKKIRLLGKWLANTDTTSLTEFQLKCLASEIIDLLSEIEESYWLMRQEADELTHEIS